MNKNSRVHPTRLKNKLEKPILAIPARVKGTKTAIEPTEEQRLSVRRMAAFGITESNMAIFLNLTLGAFKKAFAEDVKLGTDWLVKELGESLFEQAVRGNIPAASFLLRTRARWFDSPTAPLPSSGDTSVNVSGPTVLWIDNGRGPVPPALKAIKEKKDA